MVQWCRPQHLTLLAIAVGAIETVRTNPLVVADDGFAASIEAIGRDINRCGIRRSNDDRRWASEAEADENLRLRLGWGREEKSAGGDGGHNSFCNDSFYICEFHNGLLTTHE